MLRKFYLSKAWSEQKKALFLVPAIAFAVAIALSLTVYFFPQALTGPSLNAIKVGALETSSSLSPEVILLVGAVISQAPLLASLFAGLVGANISISMADIEVRTGAVEIILSRGWQIAAIVRDLALSATALGLFATSILVSGFCGASWAFLFSVDMQDHWPWQVLVLPWPCLLIGIACGLAIQLLLPGLSRVSAGTSGNIAQLLALVPTLIVFLAFTFSHRLATSALAVWGIAIAFTAIAVGLILLVIRLLEVPRLLQH